MSATAKTAKEGDNTLVLPGLELPGAVSSPVISGLHGGAGQLRHEPGLAERGSPGRAGEPGASGGYGLLVRRALGFPEGGQPVIQEAQ
jgi:hypothetical protein